MPEKTPESIKRFWRKQAESHGETLPATTPDPLLKRLELEALHAVLDPALDTLEVGCGNGYNLFSLSSRHSGRLVGVDYIDEMIDAANKRVAAFDGQAPVFHVGNLLGDLSFVGKFPQVFTDRCLINLDSLDEQLRALENLAYRVLPGGTLAIIECSQQSLVALNGLREKVGLDPILNHWHNLYLDEEAFVAGTPACLEHVETRNFSSLYYVASRVFNAKLTPAGEAPDYQSEINRISVELPSMGDYGPHKLFVYQMVT